MDRIPEHGHGHHHMEASFLIDEDCTMPMAIEAAKQRATAEGFYIVLQVDRASQVPLNKDTDRRLAWRVDLHVQPADQPLQPETPAHMPSY